MRASGTYPFSKYLQSCCWWLCSFLLITNAERELISLPIKVKLTSHLKNKKSVTLCHPFQNYGFPPWQLVCIFLLKACHQMCQIKPLLGKVWLIHKAPPTTIPWSQPLLMPTGRGYPCPKNPLVLVGAVYPETTMNLGLVQASNFSARLKFWCGVGCIFTSIVNAKTLRGKSWRQGSLNLRRDNPPNVSWSEKKLQGLLLLKMSLSLLFNLLVLNSCSAVFLSRS